MLLFSFGECPRKKTVDLKNLVSIGSLTLPQMSLQCGHFYIIDYADMNSLLWTFPSIGCIVYWDWPTVILKDKQQILMICSKVVNNNGISNKLS